MTTEGCPYCRAPITAEEPLTVCDGCGTKHDQDCYEENGGCTIFGCSCAPAEEPKLSVSVPDLAAVASSATTTAPLQTAVAPHLRLLRASQLQRPSLSCNRSQIELCHRCLLRLQAMIVCPVRSQFPRLRPGSGQLI
jgi:hypothetical protein